MRISAGTAMSRPHDGRERHGDAAPCCCANPGAILPPASAEVNILLPSVPPLGACREPMFQSDVAERLRLFQLFQPDREAPETTETLLRLARHRAETLGPQFRFRPRPWRQGDPVMKERLR